MPKNKKKFNKKSATVYTLVNKKLLPIGESDGEGIGASPEEPEEDLLIRKETEHKYGIFFNDDYDYMQHLRDVGSYEGSLEPVDQFRMGRTASDLFLDTLSVISGAQGSHGAGLDPVNLLTAENSFSGRKKQQKKELQAEADPEIVECMQEDFDFDNPDNLLDDDFITQAHGVDKSLQFFDDDEDADYPGVEDDLGPKRNYVDPTRNINREDMVDAWIEHQDPLADEEEEELEESKQKTTKVLIKKWAKMPLSIKDTESEMDFEEKRSRFSQYSITSSVVRRSQGLKDLDDHFEQMFAQYDADEIGGLDMEDLEGRSKLLLQSLMQDQAKNQMAEIDQSEDEDDKEEPAKVDQIALKFQYDEEDDKGEMVNVIIEEDDDKFDCQSVHSHYSITSFRPKLIDVPNKPKPIRINAKTGIPLAEKDDSPSEEDSENGEDLASMISSLSTQRPKNETPEERRLRKGTLKELRRERRVEKKLSRAAFSQERLRQEKEVANVERRLKTVQVV